MAVALLPLSALALTVGVHVELLGRLRHRASRPVSWWYGYARDVANLAALGGAFVAYRGTGFAPAAAFLAAALTAFFTYALDWLFTIACGLGHPRWALFTLLVLWLLLVATRATAVASAFGRLIALVQPSSG